jgi:hypothetical protein
MSPFVKNRRHVPVCINFSSTDCTAPFEASFVTDAVIDGTATTIANGNRGNKMTGLMTVQNVLRHFNVLILLVQECKLLTNCVLNTGHKTGSSYYSQT